MKYALLAVTALFFGFIVYVLIDRIRKTRAAGKAVARAVASLHENQNLRQSFGAFQTHTSLTNKLSAVARSTAFLSSGASTAAKCSNAVFW